MEEKVTKKLLTLLAVCFAGIAFMFYDFFTLAAIMLALITVMWYDWRAVICTIAVPAIYSTLLAGGNYVGIAAACGMALCALVVGLLLRKHVANRIILVVSIAFSLAVICAEFAVEAITTDTNVMQLITRGEETVFEELSLSVKSFEAMCIAALVFTGIVTGGCFFVLTRTAYNATVMMTRKQQVFHLRPMLPMQFWFLSKNFTVGMCVGLVAVIAVNILEMSSAVLISYVIAALFITPLLFQGICFMAFLMRMKGKFPFMMLIAFIFMFPMSAIVLGITDQFMRMRSKVRWVKIEKNDSPEDDRENK